MTDLQTKLRDAVAQPKYAYTPGTNERQDSYNEGVRAEYRRLAPILAALEGCVEALEAIEEERRAYDGCDDIAGALETLRKVLEAK